ncbi:MAG: NAD(P)H-hydrate dehydratase [Fidelibacterota bacterium]
MRLLTTDQARMLDQISMDKYGVSGIELMGTAGKEIAKEAILMLAEIHDPRILILSGKGNNGGDGFAAAIHLKDYNISIFSMIEDSEIKGDAAHFHEQCLKMEIPIHYHSDIPEDTEFDLIIDAILGTGTKGELRDDVSKWTQWINNQLCPVLSVDCPTGVNGTNGSSSPNTVRASKTVTFGFSKLGLHLKQGSEFSGKIKIIDIGFPDVMNELEGLLWSTFEQINLSDGLKTISIDTYKHKQGKVLIIAGSKGMTGAAILSTFGALRSGAGLTITCAPDSINDIYEKTIIEGMTVSCADNGTGYFIEESYEKISSKFDWCDAIIIGPGLGESDATKRLVKKVILNSTRPLVIDADALRIFNKNTDLFNLINVPFIITPHEGEFCRILGIHRDELINGFPTIIESFMNTFPGVLILKNAPTLTFYKHNAIVNTSGNPGMATAGMGDVLSGIIGALVSQGVNAFTASQTSVYLHGLAADHLSVSKGYRGLIASDLLNELPNVLHEFE